MNFAFRHNEFLLAILNKCQTLANMTPNTNAASPVMMARQNSDMTSPAKVKKGKVKKKQKNPQTSYDQRFQVAKVEKVKELGDLYEEEKSLKFCHRDVTLPDISMMHGRLLVMAWEESLEGVDDDSVEIMVKAVEVLLRNLIMNLVMHRRGFKTRDERFPYAVGCKRPNPYLINTQNKLLTQGQDPTDVSDVIENTMDLIAPDYDPLVPVQKPTCREADQETVLEMACGLQGEEVRRPISLFDLLELLQDKKSVIPCHTVYSLNIERVIARLYHPGHDD